MIGETLYTYDTNRRVYIGKGIGAKPDPARYWNAHVVTGENKVSWILDDGLYKADKKTLELRGIREFYALHRYAYTAEQKANKEWRDANYYRICEAVKHASADTLRQIDALLNAES